MDDLKLQRWLVEDVSGIPLFCLQTLLLSMLSVAPRFPRSCRCPESDEHAARRLGRKSESRWMVSGFLAVPVNRSYMVVDCRLQHLDSMRATDEIDEDTCKQMIFDLQKCYDAFNKFLHYSS